MQIQMGLLQVLIPSLIPIAVSRPASRSISPPHRRRGDRRRRRVVMLEDWLDTSATPRLAGLAAAVCVAGVAAIGLSVVPLREHYGSLVLETLLIPSDSCRSRPPTSSRARRTWSALTARPARPFSSRLGAAGGAQSGAAEQELRAGLKEEQILHAAGPRTLRR